MNKTARIILIALTLLTFPMKSWAQQPQFSNSQTVIEFDITEIAVFDERIFFMYNLLNDSRFNVINSEDDGVFVISADKAFESIDLAAVFADFRAEKAAQFSQMGKEEASEMAIACKSELSSEIVSSLMMDYYVRSRQNNLCANADPFCTDNGLYQFPAGVNAGSGEPGPNYACLSTTPNPAWYYMRIGTPGSISIYMYSTPSQDIDFCCWGPFEDPITPCPYGLTYQKKVSCSYSPNPTETCVIPASAQTGQYYILVITNYSNHQCNISFQKTGGTGTTDCDIMPPLVNNDGPYCVGETIHLSGNAQSGASYTWSGPGGWTASGQNVTRPNCTMAMAGSYTCTIAVSGQTSSASTNVEVFPQPTANFNFTTACQGSPTQFTSTSTTNPSGQSMSYQWNFGDGQTSTQQNPSHQYANANTYTVSLTVSCGNGQCTHTCTKQVTVPALPNANAGPDQTVQYGATAQLSGTGGAGTYNFHWEPADKVLSPNAQSTQTVPLTADQTFTLTVTNPQGNCSSTDQMTVHISGSSMSVSANASKPDICQGESTQLQANAGGGSGQFSYAWTPTTGLSNPNIYNPVATPSQTTTYTCHVTDVPAQYTQDATVTVYVHNPGNSEETVYICPNETYEWHGATYSSIGDYDYHTQTLFGCDSTVTLHLRHYPTYDETTITEYICAGESYNFYGTLYDYTCQVAYTDHTIHGCDSIVRLNLTVWPDNGVTDVPVTVCPEQLPYSFYGVDYYDATDVTVWDTDIHGCDSAVRLILNVSDYYMPEVVRKYICYEDSPSFTWNPYGNYTFTYTEDGFYTDTLPTTSCEGIFRLDLHFLPKPAVQHYTEVACDQYRWNISGQTYTATGDYPFSFPIYHDPADPSSVYDCEEEHLLHLTINQSHTNATQRFSDECDSIPFDWFGEVHYLKANGEYRFTGETTLDCDSAMLVTVSNMRYTPAPSTIKPSDVEGAIVVNDSIYAVISSTEFFSFNYEFNIHETGNSDWSTCYWTLAHPSWDIQYSFDDPSNMSYCRITPSEHTFDTIPLTATAISSCGETTRTIYLISTFFDIDENESLQGNVSIVPNPNNGSMRLDFENMEGRVRIKVFDMRGNHIDDFETQLDGNRQSYDYSMKRHADGIYFFVITDSTRTLTRKAVIIH